MFYYVNEPLAETYLIKLMEVIVVVTIIKLDIISVMLVCVVNFNNFFLFFLSDLKQKRLGLSGKKAVCTTSAQLCRFGALMMFFILFACNQKRHEHKHALVNVMNIFTSKCILCIWSCVYLCKNKENNFINVPIIIPYFFMTMMI